MGDIESSEPQPQQQSRRRHKISKAKRIALLCISIIIAVTGNCSSPLLLRTYFIHGGTRKWLSAILRTAGFPLLLLPILFYYLRRRSDVLTEPKLFFLTPPLFLACTFLGLLTGATDFLFAFGVSNLPISTTALLFATQIAFTAIFAYLIVRHKFTVLSINAVVLLTIGAVVLGVRASSDRPPGVSRGQYLLGFFMTLGAAAIFGLIMPLVELMYVKARQEVTYTLVTEMQFVLCFFATLFCIVGMAINKDFQAISREAKVFILGETKYYLVLVFAAFAQQMALMGMVATINYGSALVAGIVSGVCIVIVSVLGVFFFDEKFEAEKGIALALCVWGSASYFYGEYKKSRKKKGEVIDADQSASNIDLIATRD